MKLSEWRALYPNLTFAAPVPWWKFWRWHSSGSNAITTYGEYLKYLKQKQIKMFKDGQWVDWDGSDVKELIIEETITLAELKKYYPDHYMKIKERTK